ncbi:MAG: NnrU family protein, partial [Rhizomicrobium sp.]
MTQLMLACGLFLLLHLGIAGTALRGRIVARIGFNPYRGLFSLAALALMVWICRAYGAVYSSPENLLLFDPSQNWRNLALPVVGIAFLLGFPGFLMANPTSAGQEGASLYGVQRITRHPFLWGAAIWAAFHLIGAGDLASTILFATFLILPLAGTCAIDARARQRLGHERWQSLTATSSNLPFAAIVSGKNRFYFKEFFDGRFAASLAILLILLYFHARLFGQSP